MYDHISQGWAALCYLSIGMLAVCAFLAATFIGDRPLLRRLWTHVDPMS